MLFVENYITNTALISALYGMKLSVPELEEKEIVELLLKNGASPNPVDTPSSEAPLVTAADLGYL